MPALTDESVPNTSSTLRHLMSKVPEVTLYFWVIKVLCTTVGETASDFLNVNLNFGLIGTSIVTGIILIITLFVQFKTRQYTPVVYWINVVLISVFGTLVTDLMTDKLSVPLEYSTIFFTIALAITFAVWYAKEKTLSIHSIFTRRREAFYWLAILFTFALGTASGDLMAESLAFGYFTTAVIVAAVIAAFAIAWRSGLNAIIAFWFIYIMTRPLGASIGDFLSQPKSHGGVGLGATTTSIIFLAAIIFTVTYLALSKQDVVRDPLAEERKNEASNKNGILQLAVVIVLLLAVSLGGYFWRHNAIQASDAASAPGSAAPGTALSPLGDLSSFTTITQDTLDLVNAGDMQGAKTRVADLEYAWDTSQSRLKPRSQAKWSEIDGAVDTVLREIRAVSPNAETSRTALQNLLTILKTP